MTFLKINALSMNNITYNCFTLILHHFPENERKLPENKNKLKIKASTLRFLHLV
jgi:hypothetical protein